MERRKYTDDELFNLYVSLGNDRTIKQLSEVTGYGVQTLNNRSSKSKWGVRLKALTEEQETLVRAFVTDNSNAIAISESVIYSKLSDKLLSVLEESLLLLEPTKNIKDLKTLVDIQRLISGKPTEISQVNTVELVDLSTLTDEELDVLEKIPQA